MIDLHALLAVPPSEWSSTLEAIDDDEDRAVAYANVASGAAMLSREAAAGRDRAIVCLYRAGRSMYAIAKTVGLSKPMIHKILVREGERA
jgi:hypothetical protein